MISVATCCGRRGCSREGTAIWMKEEVEESSSLFLPISLFEERTRFEEGEEEPLSPLSPSLASAAATAAAFTSAAVPTSGLACSPSPSPSTSPSPSLSG